MRLVILLLQCCFFGSLLAGQAPSISTAAIDSAIARGTKTKDCDLIGKTARVFGAKNAYDVYVSGPLNTIECAAAAAARRYQPFTRDSVPVLDLDLLLIRVEPVKPVISGRTTHVSRPVKHVVILEGDGKGSDAIQPDSVETFPVEWSNAMGGKFESSGAFARFRLSKIPAGEFTIVVISSGEERRTKVNKKDRLIIQ